MEWNKEAESLQFSDATEDNGQQILVMMGVKGTGGHGTYFLCCLLFICLCVSGNRG